MFHFLQISCVLVGTESFSTVFCRIRMDIPEARKQAPAAAPATNNGEYHNPSPESPSTNNQFITSIKGWHRVLNTYLTHLQSKNMTGLVSCGVATPRHSLGPPNHSSMHSHSYTQQLRSGRSPENEPLPSSPSNTGRALDVRSHPNHLTGILDGITWHHHNRKKNINRWQKMGTMCIKDHQSTSKYHVSLQGFLWPSGPETWIRLQPGLYISAPVPQERHGECGDWRWHWWVRSDAH